MIRLGGVGRLAYLATERGSAYDRRLHVTKRLRHVRRVGTVPWDRLVGWWWSAGWVTMA